MPIRLSTSSARLSRADITQNAQKAWIRNTITPINRRLNTDIPSEVRNSPDQQRCRNGPRLSARSTSSSTDRTSTVA